MKSSVKITIHRIETINTTFIKKAVLGIVFNNSISYHFNVRINAKSNSQGIYLICIEGPESSVKISKN